MKCSPEIGGFSISIYCSHFLQMPKGSECNPSHMWWQGSVMYEVYVPSFQDTDNDGIGDLTGVLNRIDYLKVS